MNPQALTCPRDRGNLILLGGELLLVRDKEETTLVAGNVVAQRTTNHAWRDPTDGPV